jgi:hypothetical protein
MVFGFEVLELVLGAVVEGTVKFLGLCKFLNVLYCPEKDKPTVTIFAEKLVLVAPFLPQIPQELHCVCTWVAKIRSWQMISWAMMWPGYMLQFKV